MANDLQRDVLSGVYQHYKGELYLVLGLARHSETEEILVAYVPLYAHVAGVPLTGPRLCVRPIELFFDSVDVGGVFRARFRYLGSELGAG